MAIEVSGYKMILEMYALGHNVMNDRGELTATHVELTLEKN